jgi:glutaconate CoA-transferase subunit A
MGVPYVPVIGLVGTDLLARRDDMVLAPDPFGGGKVTVVAKAMRPDVAVFHASVADRAGNVSCGYPVEAVILAEASAHVVVTAERIVERLDESDAVGCFIPSILVDSVVHAPFGAPISSRKVNRTKPAAKISVHIIASAARRANRSRLDISVPSTSIAAINM